MPFYFSTKIILICITLTSQLFSTSRFQDQRFFKKVDFVVEGSAGRKTKRVNLDSFPGILPADVSHLLANDTTRIFVASLHAQMDARSNPHFVVGMGLLCVDLVDDEFARDHPLFDLEAFEDTPQLLAGWDTTATAKDWKSAYSYLLCRFATGGKSRDSVPDDFHSRAHIFASLASSEDGASFKDLHEILTLGAPSMEILLCSTLLRCSPKIYGPDNLIGGLSLDSLLSSRAYLAKRISPVIKQSIKRRRENSAVYEKKIFFWPPQVWSSSSTSFDEGISASENVPAWCNTDNSEDQFVFPGFSSHEEEK